MTASLQEGMASTCAPGDSSCGPCGPPGSLHLQTLTNCTLRRVYIVHQILMEKSIEQKEIYY